jgi:hypothetical protein
VTRRLVDWATSFGSFWYGFVIGDDWTAAAAVAVGAGTTWALHEAGLTAWEIMPAFALAATVLGLVRASSR